MEHPYPLMVEPKRSGDSDRDPQVIDLDQLYRAAIERRATIVRYSPRKQFPQSSRMRIAFIATVVIAGHALLFFMLAVAYRRPIVSTVAAPTVAVMEFPHAQRFRDKIVLPQIRWMAPRWDEQSLTAIQFEDSDQEPVPGIVAPASAPQLDPTVVVDSRYFAARAGLIPGEAVTVVLSIEILTDGSAGKVTVVSGPGVPAIESAAMAYVRALHWIPGTSNRRARVTYIHYPVTLALPA